MIYSGQDNEAGLPLAAASNVAAGGEKTLTVNCKSCFLKRTNAKIIQHNDFDNERQTPVKKQAPHLCFTRLTAAKHISHKLLNAPASLSPKGTGNH